jgi:glycine dehydrogenase
MSARSPWAQAPRALPAQPPAAPSRPRPPVGPDVGGARGGRREHPADLVGVHPPDGRRRAAQATEVAILERQLHRPPPRPALPGALHRAQRTGGARVHRRPPAVPRSRRVIGGGHRQAAHRLRLPRAHHVVPGGGHADDRADRVRGPGRARAVLRRDDRHPRRDRRGGIGPVARRRQPPGQRPPHRRLPHRRLDPPYSREQAAFPGWGERGDRYWPPVRRIDGGYGDRNLVCSCPPVEDLAH